MKSKIGLFPIVFLTFVILLLPIHTFAQSDNFGYVKSVVLETGNIWKRHLVEPLSKVWEPWFAPKTSGTGLYISSTKKIEKENIARGGEVLSVSTSSQKDIEGSGVSTGEVLSWLKDLFLSQNRSASVQVPTIYHSSGVTQGLADSLSRSVNEINSSIGGDVSALQSNSVFNTSVLSVDAVNTRVGIGTSSPTDTLSVNGAVYLSQISAPSNTSNRLYNTAGNLYWAGNLIGGASAGVWETDGTSVWRTSGNVGIGTTTPQDKLEVLGNITSHGVLSSVGTSGTAAQLYLLDEVNGYGGIDIYTYSSDMFGTAHPYINLISSQGSQSAPTRVLAGNDLGTLNFYGQADSGLEVGAAIGAVAAADFTGMGAQSDLYFTTNKNEKARITSAGRFGIGTTSPFAKLSVESTAGQAQFAIGSSTATQFIVDKNGNVGVGINSPRSNFDMLGSNSILTIDHSTLNAGTVGIQLSHTNGATTQQKVGILSDAVGSWGRGNLYFAVNTAPDLTNVSISDTKLMISGNSGNVGIGTDFTAAASKLGVGGGVSIGSGYSVLNAAPTNGLLVQGNVGIGTTTPWGLLSVNANGLSSGSPQFVVGSSTATNFIVANNGNVGVGTSTTSQSLTVAGNIALSTGGSIYGDSTNYQLALNASAAKLQYNGTTNVSVLNNQIALAYGSAFARFNASGLGLNVLPLNGFDVNGNAAIGASYAGIASAPSNGLIVQGNVGIGTTSPSDLLHVASTGQANISLDYGNVNAALILKNTGVQKALVGLSGGVNGFLNGSIQNDLILRTASGGNILLGSQSTSNATMYLSNGGNVGIGTTSPYAKLSIHANNGETNRVLFDISSSTAAATTSLFTILNNGNVGVGTSVPSFGKLQVNAVSGTSNLLTLSTETITANNYPVMAFQSGTSGSSATPSVTGQLRFNIHNVAPQEIARIESYASSNSGGIYNGNLIFYTQSSVGAGGSANVREKMRIDSNGNVGIGNSSPSATLSIQGTSTTNLLSIASSTGTNLFTIVPNGNVGIGTTSPQFKLDLGNGLGGASYLGWQYSPLSSNSRSWGITKDILDYGDFAIQTSAAANNTLTVTRLYIDRNGNMGIGTTGPGNKLDVFGSANVSGALGIGGVFTPSFYLDVQTASVNSQFKSTTGTNNAYTKWVNGSNSLFVGVDSSVGGTLGTNALAYAGVINSSLSALQLAANNSVAMTITTTGNVGIGTTTPWRTLSINGTVAVPGLVNDSTGYYACVNTTTGQLSTSTSACGASSERFKENIQDIGYGLEEVLGLRPVSFDYKSDYIPNAPKQLGFIAEEVDLLVPELVARDSAGQIQGLDYPKFVSVIVKAIQEMNKKIDDSLASVQVAFDKYLASNEVYIRSANVDDLKVNGNLNINSNICVDDTCITKEQFKEMILRSGVGAVQVVDGIGEGENGGGDSASSTPEIIPETSEENATTTEEVIEEVATTTPEVVE